MKILGFAHVSICFSTQQMYLINNFLNRTLSYESVKNNKMKFNFMESQDELHRISLDIPGMEICLYESASIVSPSELQEICSALTLSNAGSVQIDSLPDKYLKDFLYRFGKVIDRETSIEVKGFPLMRNLCFIKNHDSLFFKTNHFVDNPGLASLALYTDSVLDKDDCLSLGIDYWDAFPVHFNNRSFLVQILRIGGVNVELIARPSFYRLLASD